MYFNRLNITNSRANEEKKQEHCGKCPEFPCDKLKEWASSENPERIDNLKKL
jgi:hypothetical protein